MDKQKKMHELEVLAAQIRVETMKIIGARGFGHVGGSMSMADAMAVVYGAYMKIDPKNPRWEDRDWFVMSKGHAGPAMYATLGIMGYYPVSDAYKLNQPGTDFPSHTDRNKTKGVDLTTGSLGQGISEAVGAALGLKMQKKDNKVFVAIGDGEADEGQVWEAAQFAAHYNLDNLICLVDNNKRQLDGPTDEIMSHKKGIGARFDSLGWNVIDVKDGNDIDQLNAAFEEAKTVKGKPTVLIANTIKGCGSSVMEDKAAWHHHVPSQEEYEQIMKDFEERKEQL